MINITFSYHTGINWPTFSAIFSLINSTATSIIVFAIKSLKELKFKTNGITQGSVFCWTSSRTHNLISDLCIPPKCVKMRTTELIFAASWVLRPTESTLVITTAETNKERNESIDNVQVKLYEKVSVSRCFRSSSEI